MKLLLDSHAFLWWNNDPQKLTPHVLEMCKNSENVLMLSVVSIWELQIKYQLEKLRLNKPLQEIIYQEQQENGIEILPIESTHIFGLESLPNHHKDPFDRLLISQAIVEGAIFISADPLIKKYPIKVEW
jgi:PIN domain nuclease of toxin-antitoxin system